MTKYLTYAFALLLLSSEMYGCPSCNQELNEAIYNESFYNNLFVSLSAFWALALIVGILLFFYRKAYAADGTPVKLITASLILGIGLGGLIDGIVLHQILQWHEMFSNQIPNTDYIGKSVNTFWDGIFHAFCFLVILTGVILLQQLHGKEYNNRSGKVFTGGLLAGWGLFNTVEGIINHHLLKLHNVQEVSLHQDTANFTFLIASALLLLTGCLMIRKQTSAKLLMNK